MYERLFLREDMNSIDDDFKNHLNPSSLQVLPKVYAEPELSKAKLGKNYQFLRMGYFVMDPDSKDGQLVFNRTVTLRDSK